VLKEIQLPSEPASREKFLDLAWVVEFCVFFRELTQFALLAITAAIMTSISQSSLPAQDANSQSALVVVDFKTAVSGLSDLLDTRAVEAEASRVDGNTLQFLMEPESKSKLRDFAKARAYFSNLAQRVHKASEWKLDAEASEQLLSNALDLLVQWPRVHAFSMPHLIAMLHATRFIDSSKAELIDRYERSAWIQDRIAQGLACDG